MKSTEPSLELEYLNKVPIPLIVSEKLQIQIYHLCSQVYDKEWSGTLFYRTEGEFGSPEFKVFAEEVFLQDIGSAAYTEYDGGTPEFIQFMMKNPDVLEMQRGHIHSHNTMAVFFSGTDDSELVDNSELYNYYVSLIVNNRNEMTAKVAFRAECKTTRNKEITFKGNDGKETTVELTDVTVKPKVYCYDCVITKPGILSDSFRNRISEVQLGKSEPKTKGITAGSSKNGRYESFKGGPKEREYNAELFPSESPSVYEQTPEFSREMAKEEKTEMVIDKERIIELRVMMASWLSHVGGKIKNLNSVLREANEYLYDNSSNLDHIELMDIKRNYYKEVKETAETFYESAFPDDEFLLEIGLIMDQCVNILDDYYETYPTLIGEIRSICIGIRQKAVNKGSYDGN